MSTLLAERILGTLVPTCSQTKDDGPQGSVGDDEPSEDELMQGIDDAQAAMDPHDTESGSQSVGAGPVDLCELRDLYDSLMKVHYVVPTSEYSRITPALFQTIDILLEADKPALAEAIWKQLPPCRSQHSAATECAICSG